MEDFPWIYVAMIFIAFVSWLHQRIQEAAAARKIRSAQRKTAAEAARHERPLGGEFRPSAGPPALPAPAPSRPTSIPEPSTPRPAAPSPEAEIPVPRSLRELIQTLETLSNPPAETPEPRTVVAPPPLPVTPVVTEAPAPPPRPSVAPVPEAGTRPSPATGLTGVLRRRGSLREALILKEVLDSPVSLR